MNKWKIILLATVCAFGENSFEPLFRFRAERIAIDISTPQVYRVHALYHFERTDPKLTLGRIRLPFPEYDSGGIAYDAMVTQGERTRDVDSVHNSRIDFPVFFKAADTASVILDYKQPLVRDTGRYILTSTAEWNAPLDSAVITISIADSLDLSWISYAVDTVLTDSSTLTYRFNRRSFMPDRDLLFRVEQVN